ncbi:MAG TPA: HAMP domain-containing sensor histidine kinase, partial [Gaiellaceae bacterium]|nr:HAMP domain-containing sensor histidine kinase [Gaiellaceae bacterium]
LAFVVGDAIFSWYDVVLERSPPIPSGADALYLAGYPLLFAGIVVLIWRLPTVHSVAALLDVAIISVGFTLAQWIFLIDRYTHGSMPFGDRVVAMAYPAVDILLVAGFAQLVVRPEWRAWSYTALFVSVLLLLVGDEFYGTYIDSYASGSWIDAFWLLSSVLWGAAALDSTAVTLEAGGERRAAPRLTRVRLLLLGCALLTAPAVLVIEVALGHRIHAYELAIGGAVLSALVLVRLTGLVAGLDRARGAERSARRDAEQAQRLLREQNERLVELDRLKDEFVSLVSHDLRTPLTSISGYVELLLESERLDDESRGFLDVVDRNTNRLLHLVDDLLFVARVAAGRLELELTEVDLGAVAEHCVDTARPRASSAGIELELVLDGGAAATGEPHRLSQLLDNLVSNALKFTPDGGRVRVRVGREGPSAVVEVSDTGIGIPPEERAHLFERFYRAPAAVERQIQGTGLGLHIAKAIVDAHGGRISVAPHEGPGTTFRVELPGA